MQTFLFFLKRWIISGLLVAFVFWGVIEVVSLIFGLYANTFVEKLNTFLWLCVIFLVVALPSNLAALFTKGENSHFFLMVVLGAVVGAAAGIVIALVERAQGMETGLLLSAGLGATSIMMASILWCIGEYAFTPIKRFTRQSAAQRYHANR